MDGTLTRAVPQDIAGSSDCRSDVLNGYTCGLALQVSFCAEAIASRGLLVVEGNDISDEVLRKQPGFSSACIECGVPINLELVVASQVVQVLAQVKYCQQAWSVLTVASRHLPTNLPCFFSFFLVEAALCREISRTSRLDLFLRSQTL